MPFRSKTWLLRLVLLAIIAYAVYLSLPTTLTRDYGYHQQDATAAKKPGAPEAGPHDSDGPKQTPPLGSTDGGAKTGDTTLKGHNNPRGNAIVIASQKGDNMAWLDLVPGWEHAIYVTNAGEGDAGLKVPKNKGREGMVFLTFMIDNYDNLPNVTIFHHSKRYQWHNDDPGYDSVPVLQNLRLAHIHESGYVNLRCCWTLGCPAEIHPFKLEQSSAEFKTESYYADAFKVLFPDLEVPEKVGVACCAQFAVTRAQILSRPLSDYIRFRQWLLDTPVADNISGRILEYSWHIMFGKPPVHCPDAKKCYEDNWGLTGLKCTGETCEGRYRLPTYSFSDDEVKDWV